MSILLLIQVGTAVHIARPVKADEISPQVQGHADRVAFEAWIQGLTAEQHAGADFWAAERSKLHPAPCRNGSVSPDFVAGCQQAQQRLAASDVRRRIEPDYRAGWNSPLTDAPSSPSNLVQRSSSWQNLKISSRNGKVVSKAMGLAASQIQLEHPTADCSGDLCEFNKQETPQGYCPDVGACENIVFFLSHEKVVVGYMADFNVLDWSRSLEASIKLLGPPEKKVVNPSGLIRMRNDYWSWLVGNNLTLTYNQVSGVNAYGIPLNAHVIMLDSSR